MSKYSQVISQANDKRVLHHEHYLVTLNERRQAIIAEAAEDDYLSDRRRTLKSIKKAKEKEKEMNN